jgi:hypothetical protein
MLVVDGKETRSRVWKSRVLSGFNDGGKFRRGSSNTRLCGVWERGDTDGCLPFGSLWWVAPAAGAQKPPLHSTELNEIFLTFITYSPTVSATVVARRAHAKA